MQEVLISIKPEYVKLILEGKKTIEVRKSKPKIDTPFKVFIYESKKRRKIVGHFICNKIYQYSTYNIGGQTMSEKEMVEKSCLSVSELEAYEDGAEAKDFCCYRVGLFGWNITNLKIYDTPLPLDCFSVTDNKAINRAPQSWCYIKERESND